MDYIKFWKYKSQKDEGPVPLSSAHPVAIKILHQRANSYMEIIWTFSQKASKYVNTSCELSNSQAMSICVQRGTYVDLYLIGYDGLL